MSDPISVRKFDPSPPWVRPLAGKPQVEQEGMLVTANGSRGWVAEKLDVLAFSLAWRYLSLPRLAGPPRRHSRWP
jgi:hypothetical protein